MHVFQTKLKTNGMKKIPLSYYLVFMQAEYCLR